MSTVIKDKNNNIFFKKTEKQAQLQFVSHSFDNFVISYCIMFLSLLIVGAII